MDTEQRYLAKVDRCGPDDCWPWTAGCFRNGYGKFWDGTDLPSGRRRSVKAHRWGYGHFIGPIPDGYFVCHRCDNPPCQNPSHWFLGTSFENVRDMVLKGRARGPQKDVDVVLVRLLYSFGVTQVGLAARFGVAQSTIGRIVRSGDDLTRGGRPRLKMRGY